MTRVYSWSVVSDGCFSFRVGLYQRNLFYGVIEVLYTSSDIHCVDYSQRFVAQTLAPGMIGLEISNAINKVLRLRAGDSIEDIRALSRRDDEHNLEHAYPEPLRFDILMTDFDSQENF